MTTQLINTRRALGRTGISVTPLALGGAWLGFDSTSGQRNEDVGIQTVLHALSLGIRVIDTSPGYGVSEVFIGKALREWFKQGGSRSDLVISSKTGTRVRPHDYSRAHTWHSVEQSLQSLGVSYIDVMHVHDPHRIEPIFAEDGALSVLQEMKAQGMISAIGLGVRNQQFHEYCMKSGDFDVSLTYGDHNLLNQTADGLLNLASDRGVGIFNAMVVEYGLLGGTDPLQVAARWNGHENKAKVARAREIWEWCQQRGINVLSLAIQYSARDIRIASTLIGAASPAEIEADVDALNTHIPDDVWSELHEHFGI
jgi:D-threo-aldose 1-dehydrogenase